MFTKVVAEVGVLVLLGASTLLAQAGDATSSGSGGGESSGSSSSSSSEGGDASGGRSGGTESGGGDGGTSGSSDTGDSSSDTGDSSSDTGDSTSETGDSGPRFGDSGTGDAGRRNEPAAQPVEAEDGSGQAILGTFAALLLAIVASALIAVSIRERGRQADPP